MRLATIETAEGTAAVRVDGETLTAIPGYADVGELLAAGEWERVAAEAAGPAVPAAGAVFRTPVPRPGKVLCVGLNYTRHIREMGRPLPEHPSVFAKFAETLTGPFAEIPAIPEDPAMDWEGELAMIVGREAYRVSEAAAEAHIAGYAVANDISMRTWQNRTSEWLQGKIWAGTTPLGPHLVSRDEVDLGAATLRTLVNGEVVQEERTADLLFTPPRLLAYLSTILPLRPGDIVLTGTPGGVGHARRPPAYLKAGDTVEVEITGVGRIRNRIVAPL